MASPVSQSNFPSVMNLLSWGSISYICRRFTLWGRYALHEHLRPELGTILKACIDFMAGKIIWMFSPRLVHGKANYGRGHDFPSCRVFHSERWYWNYSIIGHNTKYTQKDSILEGKVCIEHVIFWWKMRCCAEKGPRDRMLMAVIVLSHYTLLITWTIELLLKLDMIPWCVVCFMHESTQHQPTPPPPLPLLVGAQQLKGTGTSLFNAAPYIPTHGNRDPVAEPRQLWPSIWYIQIVLNWIRPVAT